MTIPPRHYNGCRSRRSTTGTVGTLQGLVPFSCAFRASCADRPEQRNQMLLSDFSGISLDGATWRSGYAAVCKTVYTSSILVVASIHIINGLAGLYERPQQLFSRRRASLPGTGSAARPARGGCHWQRAAAADEAAMSGPKYPPHQAQWPFARRPAIDRTQLHSSRSPACCSGRSQIGLGVGLNGSFEF